MPMSEIVTTWSQVMPGDVIRGADGREWLVRSVAVSYGFSVERNIVMIDFNYRVVEGRPRGDSAVTILRPAPIREIMAIFEAAGMPLTYLSTETEETNDSDD